MSKRYLTVAEFARATGLKPGTVRKRCQRGVYRCRPHRDGEHWQIVASEITSPTTR